MVLTVSGLFQLLPLHQLPIVLRVNVFPLRGHQRVEEVFVQLVEQRRLLGGERARQLVEVRLEHLGRRHARQRRRKVSRPRGVVEAPFQGQRS